MIGEDVFYFRRSLETRVGAAGSIVYAVRATEPDKRLDAVPVIGAFPPRWRPIAGIPGFVHAVQSPEPAIVPCEVPRNQFRHYQRLTEAQALSAASQP